MSADNHQLGHFKIEGLKLAKRGTPQVQVSSRYYIYKFVKRLFPKTKKGLVLGVFLTNAKYLHF